MAFGNDKEVHETWRGFRKETLGSFQFIWGWWRWVYGWRGRNWYTGEGYGLIDGVRRRLWMSCVHKDHSLHWLIFSLHCTNHTLPKWYHHHLCTYQDVSSRRVGTHQDVSSRRLGTHQDVSSRRLGTHQDVSSRRLGTHQDVISRRLGTHQDVSSRRLGAHQDVSSRRLGLYQGVNSRCLDAYQDVSSRR